MIYERPLRLYIKRSLAERKSLQFVSEKKNQKLHTYKGSMVEPRLAVAVLTLCTYIAMPEDSTKENASTSSSSVSNLSILDHPSASLKTTTSVVLTHDRHKDRTAKPSLSPSQLARHSEGAIDARSTLSRHMRTAGYVPLPHSHSHADVSVPLVDTPMNPPPFSPLAIAHLTLSAAIPTTMQEDRRGSACGTGIPDDLPCVFTPEDTDVSTLASCPLHGETTLPTWTTSPCFCGRLEVQALFESAILPFAGSSSQDTVLSTDNVTANSVFTCRHAPTPSLARSTFHPECGPPASSLAGDLIMPSTPVSLLGPKGNNTRLDTDCGCGREHGEDETRESHLNGDTRKSRFSKTASPQPASTKAKGKGKEFLRSTSSCCHGIDTVPRILGLCSPGCTMEACCCCSSRCANDTEVH